MECSLDDLLAELRAEWPTTVISPLSGEYFDSLHISWGNFLVPHEEALEVVMSVTIEGWLVTHIVTAGPELYMQQLSCVRPRRK